MAELLSGLICSCSGNPNEKKFSGSLYWFIVIQINSWTFTDNSTVWSTCNVIVSTTCATGSRREFMCQRAIWNLDSSRFKLADALNCTLYVLLYVSLFLAETTCIIVVIACDIISVTVYVTLIRYKKHKVSTRLRIRTLLGWKHGAFPSIYSKIVST
jgi:hypothetical protein